MARRPPRRASRRNTAAYVPDAVRTPAREEDAPDAASAIAEDEAARQRQERYRKASSAFRARDFRKPQLSAEVEAPLADTDRRRPSGVRVLDPTELHLAETAPRPTPEAGGSDQRTGAPPTPAANPTSIPGQRRPTPIPHLSTPPRGDDDPETWSVPTGPDALNTVTSGLFVRPLGQPPWASMVALALLCLLGSLGLPALDGGDLFGFALLRESATPWALGGRLSVGLVLFATLSVAVAGSQGALRARASESALPNLALMGAALLAAAHLGLRSAATPGVLDASLWPLRGHFVGVPDAAWWGLAAGGLLALPERQDQRQARTVALVAGLLLLLLYWTPLGFVGESRLPLFTALGSFGATAPAAGALLTRPWMASPLVAALSALLPLLIFAALLWRGSLRVVQAVGALCLVFAGLAPALASGSGGVMTLIGVSSAAFGTALLVAAATGLTLDRLTTRWDDEALNALELGVVALIFTVWIVAKINGMKYSATDEGIYFYAAKAWANGLWPYHDFFFSHPPLHIAVPGLIFAAAGFSFTTAKALSIAAAGIAGVFVWRIGRRRLDPLSGVLALGLFLFASEVLKSSTNLTGINLTTMWATAGLWAALRRRSFLAGALLGAAAATGFYAIGYFLSLIVLALFAPNFGYDKHAPMLDRVMSQSAVQLLLGFLVVFGTTNLIFYLLAGEAYLDGVYRYHFLKHAKTPGFTPLSEGLHAFPKNLKLMLEGRDFRISLYYHGAHYVLAALAPLGVIATVAVRRYAKAKHPERFRAPKGVPARLADRSQWAMLYNPQLWWMHRNAGGTILLLTALTWALLTEFAQFKERFDFYYTLLLPPVSLLAASWLHSLVRLGRVVVGAGLSWRRPADGPESKGLRQRAPAWAAPVLAVFVALTLLWVPVNMWANATAYPSEITPRGSSKGAGEVLSFAWTDAPGPAVISDLTRHLLWKDHRVRGNLEAGLHHYLWSKKRWFSTAEAIAAYIHDNSKSEETITGSSTHAPLVALLAKRRMAGDHIDTNSKTFKTGVVSREGFWQAACKDHVRYIVAGPRSYFSPRSMPRRPTVRKHFRLVRTFSDPHLKHWRPVTIQLWERKYGTATPCTYEGPQPPYKRARSRRGQRRQRRQRGRKVR